MMPFEKWGGERVKKARHLNKLFDKRGTDDDDKTNIQRRGRKEVKFYTMRNSSNK